MDDSTFARDVIDLAFLAARSSRDVIAEGLLIANAAYGRAVATELKTSLTRLSARGRLAACLKALAIDDVATLKRGLKALAAIRAR